MPSTYTLISSNVLTSSAASVTFSSIPSTYTDLVLRCSTRATGYSNLINYYFNGNTSNTSFTSLFGNGSIVNYSNSTGSYGIVGPNSRIDATANTFSSSEIYIPNYAGSTKKPVSSFGVSESNTASGITTPIRLTANLTDDTTAITTIDLIASFDTGSSFYLYGIKNS
jgi:hypothetical protein